MTIFVVETSDEVDEVEMIKRIKELEDVKKVIFEAPGDYQKYKYEQNL